MPLDMTKMCDDLGKRISAAGHWLVFEDGPVCDDEKAVAAIIDAYTLDEAKDGRCREVDLHARQLLDASMADFSIVEALGWERKRAEASGAEATVVLAAEAQARGIDVATLKAKVLANADGQATREAQITGIAGKHKDVIRSLGDFAALNAYDFSQGWPNV